jgi:hypothetical protein
MKKKQSEQLRRDRAAANLAGRVENKRRGFLPARQVIETRIVEPPEPRPRRRRTLTIFDWLAQLGTWQPFR